MKCEICKKEKKPLFTNGKKTVCAACMLRIGGKPTEYVKVG